jgi:hypothetical protein
VKMLTLFDGLCCVGFIKPIGVVAGVRKQRLALSIRPRINSQPGVLRVPVKIRTEHLPNTNQQHYN